MDRSHLRYTYPKKPEKYERRTEEVNRVSNYRGKIVGEDFHFPAAGGTMEVERKARSWSGVEEKAEKNGRAFPLVGALKAIIIILSVVLVLEIAFHFIVSPRLLLKEVTIETGPGFPLSNEDLLRIAGIERNDYYFLLDEEGIRERLLEYPLIREARVEKIFPDTLSMVLSGREPLGCAFVPTNEGSIPVVFDQEGVIFQIGSSLTEWDLPVVSGIRFEQVQLGMKLPRELRPFLQDLGRLKKNSPELFSVLSEIRFEQKGNTGFETILYPVHIPVKVRIGREISAHTLTYMLIVLDVVAREGRINILKEIDMRTGEVVYKVKEE